MRVLFVARRCWPDVRSGTETVFAALLAEARASGHEAPLLAGYTRSMEGFPPDTAGVDLRGAGLVPGGAWARMATATQAAVARHRPDIVLSNSVECVPAGVPTALVVHDLNFGDGTVGAPVPRARALAYRMQCARAAAVITPSQATRAKLVGIGVAAERVHVVPNGVDLGRFFPETRGGRRLRFLVPGRILPGKNALAALDALGRLRPDVRAGVELVVAGAAADPVYLDRLRVQCWNLPVTIRTDVPDLAAEMRDADVIVAPSRMEEGFGLTVLEGMASGKPVIAFDQPAVREACGADAGGGGCVLVPMDDVVAMRDAMQALALDPDRRAALGRNGRAWAETRTWSRAWEGYAAVLAGCARR